MRELIVGVASISDPEMLKACILSLREQRGLSSEDVYVVCNSGRVLEECRAWERLGVNVRYPGTNIGTCASWNWFVSCASVSLRLGVLILGDDVVLRDPETYASMCRAVAGETRAFWEIKGLGFSGFGLPLAVTEEVGLFDENLWPAYFEDNDYHRRVNLRGIPTRSLHTPFDHVGSGSLRRWTEWEWWNAAYAFVTNSSWYMEKWGGPPGREVFEEPWDGHPELAWSVKDRLMRDEVARRTRPKWDYDNHPERVC